MTLTPSGLTPELGLSFVGKVASIEGGGNSGVLSDGCSCFEHTYRWKICGKVKFMVRGYEIEMGLASGMFSDYSLSLSLSLSRSLCVSRSVCVCACV